MEQRLAAPSQPVWERYLDTLVRLAQLVTGEQRRAEYFTRLGESLVSKQPQARAVSLSSRRSPDSQVPQPSLDRASRDSLAAQEHESPT
jgi:hypothetical protein